MLEGYTTAEEGYIKGAVKDPLDVRNVKRGMVEFKLNTLRVNSPRGV